MRNCIGNICGVFMKHGCPRCQKVSDFKRRLEVKVKYHRFIYVDNTQLVLCMVLCLHAKHEDCVYLRSKDIWPTIV